MSVQENAVIILQQAKSFQYTSSKISAHIWPHTKNSFPFDAPRVWNDLHDDVRSAQLLPVLKNMLKSYLFKNAFHFSI